MKRWVILVALTAVLVAAAFAASYLQPKPDDRLPTPSGYRFWAGVNYPWKSYQDFGTGAWGHSGVSNQAVYDEIDTDLSNIAATGIQVVKWRVFNDGRYSPEFADDGTVVGLDDKFFEDVDAALEIASRHNLYLVLSLFDSGLWATGCERDGVQIGGHADLMLDPAKRRSLIRNAIVPLVRHVGWGGPVLAFEVLAEPEWGITELQNQEDQRITVPLADVQAFVEEATTAIHRNGGRLVTVESNRPSHMRYWQGLGLDYYTFSWYDWMKPYDPLDVPAGSYGLDRPIVVGEYPIEGSQYYDFSQVLDIALAQGYAGALAWSYGAPDKYGSLRNVYEGYAAWLREHWRAVDLSQGAVEPPTTVAMLPPPFSYQDVRVTKDGDSVMVEVGLSVRQGGNFHVQLFLYPFGSRPERPTADRTLAIQSGAQGTLRLRLPETPESRVYKLSMAIFDDQWTMRKWFDSMSIFSLENGQVSIPSLTDLEKEDPCARPPNE